MVSALPTAAAWRTWREELSALGWQWAPLGTEHWRARRYLARAHGWWTVRADSAAELLEGVRHANRHTSHEASPEPVPYADPADVHEVPTARATRAPRHTAPRASGVLPGQLALFDLGDAR